MNLPRLRGRIARRNPGADAPVRIPLTPPATAGQRISRAKRTLRESGVAFDQPDPTDQRACLSSVLEVVYLIFNEGYAASSGHSWTRPDLAGEALRLGRVLVHLMPRQPDVHGLLALMELQAPRFPARLGANGPVLLEDQDRTLWDRLLIHRGLEGLLQESRLQRHHLLHVALAELDVADGRPVVTVWPRLSAGRLVCFLAVIVAQDLTRHDLSAMSTGSAIVPGRRPSADRRRLFVSDAPPGTRYPDTVTWHGQVHDLAGGLAFLGLFATCLTTRHLLSRRWGLACASTIATTFVAGSVMAAVAWSGSSTHLPSGLAERAAMSAGIGWLVALALHLNHAITIRSTS